MRKKLKFNAFTLGIVGISVVLLILILGVSVFVNDRFSKTEISRILTQVQSVSERHDTELTTFLETAAQNTQTISALMSSASDGKIFSDELVSGKLFGNGQMVTDVKAKVSASVSTIFKTYDALNQFDSLVLVNMDGYYYVDNEWGRSEGTMIGSVESRQFFLTAKEGNVAISDVLISKINYNSVFAIAVPVMYKESIVGVLCALYSSEQLASSMNYNGFVEDSITVVAGKYFNNLTDLNNEDTERILSAARNEFTLLKGEIKDNYFTFKDGKKEYYCYTTRFEQKYLLDSAVWNLITLVPSESVSQYSKDYTLYTRIIIALVAVVLVVGFIGILIILRKSRLVNEKETNKIRKALDKFKKYTFEFNLDTKRIQFGIAAQKMLNLPAARYELSDLVDNGLIPAEVYANINTLDEQLKIEGKTEFNIKSEKLNKYFHIELNMIQDNVYHQNFMMGLIEDVTDVTEKNQALELKAKVDGLTRLYNRSATVELAGAAIENNAAKRNCLILLDVDNFKQINDRYGHYTGDVVLQKVADILKETSGANAVVGRMGGDEFCVFKTDMPTSDSVKTFVKFLCGRLSTIEISEEDGSCASSSLGVAVYPKNGKTFTDLYQCADNALYKSKEKIGTYYTIYDSISSEGHFGDMEEVKEHKAKPEDNFSLMVNTEGENGVNKIKSILKDALANKEIELYRQPKISTKGGRTEAEVLSRWNNAEYGLLMPNKFVPLFEKIKQIDKLDMYVIEQVMSDIAASYDKCPDHIAPLSVNQALQTITSPNYIKELTALCQKYTFPKELITIEVTERGLFMSMRTITKVIRNLGELGFKISLDDFGSGFTTLAILKDLDIDEIKIDKTFMEKSKINSDRADVITKEICRMAKDLHIVTVAEGVETKEQVDYLKSIGCDYLQGFYFDRALPKEEFEKNLKEGKYKL